MEMFYAGWAWIFLGRTDEWWKRGGLRRRFVFSLGQERVRETLWVCKGEVGKRLQDVLWWGVIPSLCSKIYRCSFLNLGTYYFKPRPAIPNAWQIFQNRPSRNEQLFERWSNDWSSFGTFEQYNLYLYFNDRGQWKWNNPEPWHSTRTP